MTETVYPRIGETVLNETLPNGLRVCIVKKPDYQRRYAFFAARYGGMDTRFSCGGALRDTPAGIAHYLEHKLFDTEDGSALQRLAQNGAEPNAFTAGSMTAYHLACTEHFEENLRILLSFVSVPYFTRESVEKERGIIAQEIRMTEDSPDWRIYNDLLQCLYRTSPARIPIAGTVESIGSITPELLYECHRAFYVPSNMMLCVVGSVDPEAVLACAREVLPQEPGAGVLRDYGPDESPLPAQKESRRAMEVASTQFLAGFKCRADWRGGELLREQLIGSLAYDVLLGGSSPLYTHLYDAGLINGSFGGSYDQLPGAAHLCAGGESRDPQAVVRAILDEAARYVREDIEPDYFETLLRANFGASLRALGSFENIAADLTEGYFHGYDPFRFPEVYRAVTRADVRRFLQENLTEERCAVSVLTPREVTA